MPTYDYVCDRCGHAFEHFQGISEALLRKCPECGKLALRRLIGTGAGVLFKGSGFYETDYKRKPEDKGSKPSDPSAAEKKTESGKDAGGVKGDVTTAPASDGSDPGSKTGKPDAKPARKDAGKSRTGKDRKST